MSVSKLMLDSVSSEIRPSNFNFYESPKPLDNLCLTQGLLQDLQGQAEMQKRLSGTIPYVEGIEVSISTVPASGNTSTGDFYLVKSSKEKELALLVGDVEGKGHRAAPVTAYLQGFLTAMLDSEVAIGRVLNQMNNALFQIELLTTVIFGKVDLQKKTYTYSSAGHPPGVLYQSEFQQIKWLNAGGIIAGAIPFPFYYEEETVDLHYNDLLVFYTDGVLEASNRHGELFGSGRLRDIISDHASDSNTSDLIDHIFAAVEEFVAGEPIGDDMTILLARIL